VRTAALIPLVGLVGCGGSSEPPAPVRAPIGLTATADGSGDVIVARVDGAPIWASCVAAQARATHGSVADGLRQCEDFELLAHAAAARGEAAAPEVAEAADTALVSKLIATDFEVKYAEPSSIASIVDQKLRASGEAGGHEVPEGRATAYLRVDVPKGADAATDAAAHALALELAAPLRARTGLFASDLKAAAISTPQFKVESAEVPLRPAYALDRSYADPLFALPTVGVVTEPVRTKWGWDIILATDIQPAHFWTRDELVAKMFPEVRRAQFGAWADAIAEAAHIPVSTATNWRQLLQEPAP